MARRAAQAFLTFLFFLWAATVGAQETNSEWYARAWQSSEGLPDNSVEGLAQTPDGYLWIGTPSGLVRFDGIRFEEASLKNVVSNPNRGVLAILPCREGGLWLAMDRGAVVWLNGAASQAYVDGLPETIPNGMAEDAAGALWIAYHGGTVYRLKNGHATQCSAEQGLPGGGEICALATDNKGRVWFGKA